MSIALPALLWSFSTQAQKLPHNLQIHGFVSQGWLKSSDNNVFGKSSSDSGSFDFRELGLNASMRPLPRLQFSAQMLSRTAGEGSPGNVRLDFGFIDYKYFSGETSQLGIRLGRMKNPLGFYNDTRDVPFTRPSILLPQSIYFDRTRKLAIAADGVHLYGERRSDMGNISFQLGVVRPLVRGAETEVALLGGERRGHLTPDISYVSRVMYELDEGRLRFAVSATQLNTGYDPAGDFLQPGSIRFTPLIFSAQYNAERWSITSEYALRRLEFKDFGVAPLTLDFYGESYYFQGVYRFTPAWEGFVRYDVLYTDRTDRDGSKWAASPASGGRPAHTRFAKDIAVGLRWNITPEFMLRAEYHNVNGTGWLSTLDNTVPGDMAQHWHLFSVLGSYRF
ncbi:MAG: OprO/OprP family phosphate-selective porin [Pseudomonadota bacterium]|nr:OprO/OprP family phosphate-selective porin [Pseudomonadota bacterium]